ncbi:MAG: substrate-binding domain-containing protein, partial [Actinobacteria bacterium]|nr:substrate-binding domain-containing protein [Actinomycetota bacterium]
MSDSEKQLNELFKPIELKKPADLIFEQIVELISSGILKIGDQLPSEEELQKRFNIGRAYVKKALGRLLSIGMLKVNGEGEIIVNNIAERTQSGLPSRKNLEIMEFDVDKIKNKNYKIGFSQTTLDHPARRYMDSRFHEYAKKVGVIGITKDAKWSTEREILNVRDLISQKVNGIIISTHSGHKIEPAVIAVSNAKIPTVIFTSGKPVGNWPFDIWACTDEWQQGRIAGYYLCTTIGGIGKVAQIQGTLESSVTEGRRDGLLTALDDFPEVVIVANISTNWQRDPTTEATFHLIADHPDLKAIVTHCDEQAIGAVIAIKKIGRHKGLNKIYLFSVSDCQKEAF